MKTFTTKAATFGLISAIAGGPLTEEARADAFMDPGVIAAHDGVQAATAAGLAEWATKQLAQYSRNMSCNLRGNLHHRYYTMGTHGESRSLADAISMCKKIPRPVRAGGLQSVNSY